jgi:hypothetical protein
MLSTCDLPGRIRFLTSEKIGGSSHWGYDHFDKQFFMLARQIGGKSSRIPDPFIWVIYETH